MDELGRNTGGSPVVLNAICEFLETVFYNILYMRKIYPDSIFECKRKFGIVVYNTIHPDLHEYIANCIKTINFHLSQHYLKSVSILIKLEQKTLERYNIKPNLTEYLIQNDSFLIALEEGFRSFILNLDYCIQHLPSLPENSTFSIELSTTDTGSIHFCEEYLSENFSWIVSNTKDAIDGNFHIIPISRISNDIISLQSCIEVFN